MGNIDIKVKSSSGNTYTSLYTGNANLLPSPFPAECNYRRMVLGYMVDGQPTAATTGSGTYAPNWSTGALLPSGQNAYPAGVYTVHRPVQT